MQGLQYTLPRVAVIEQPSRPSANAGVSVGTIGLVGTFSKGPIGTPTTCYSINDLISKFGGYVAGLTGYLSALGAFNQGVTSLVVVRTAAASVKAASLDLLDAEGTPAGAVTVTALWKGTDGNNISVQVEAGTAASTFKLTVRYKKVVQEVWDNLSLTNLAINSQYVTLTEDAGAVQIPAPLSDTPLTGGDDGAITADADYVGTIDANGNRTGLKALEPVNVNIIVCAQQSSAAIQQAMITHCQQANVTRGLRIAVLNTAKGITPTAAEAAQVYNEARAIMTYPWLTPVEYTTLTVAPDGYYAGILATLNPWVSPSNQTVKGIINTERALIDDDLIALTQARLSPIAYNNATQDFRIANGVNTYNYVASNGSDDWSQTSTRREFDKIEMEIWTATQWAKSQPITNDLMLRIKAQIDELLRQHRDVSKEIYDFKPTICDSSNNTADTIAARKLNTQVFVRPLFAADFIDHSIGRYIG